MMFKSLETIFSKGLNCTQYEQTYFIVFVENDISIHRCLTCQKASFEIFSPFKKCVCLRQKEIFLFFFDQRDMSTLLLLLYTVMNRVSNQPKTSKTLARNGKENISSIILTFFVFAFVELKRRKLQFEKSTSQFFAALTCIFQVL